MLDWLRRFQEAADEGSVNRDWNVTTNMVITGEALMQIHGDWMKGEWRAAGKVAGEDFGCMQIPGAEAVPVTVDAWGILGDQSEAMDAGRARLRLGRARPRGAGRSSPPTRAPPRSGSTPPATSTPAARRCSAISRIPSTRWPNPHTMVDADWQSSLWDVLFNYWSDPSMTADEAIEQMKSNYDLILG